MSTADLAEAEALVAAAVKIQSVSRGKASRTRSERLTKGGKTKTQSRQDMTDLIRGRKDTKSPRAGPAGLGAGWDALGEPPPRAAGGGGGGGGGGGRAAAAGRRAGGGGAPAAGQVCCQRARRGGACRAGCVDAVNGRPL